MQNTHKEQLLQKIDIPSTEKISLTWQNIALTITQKKNKLKIINTISGHATSGETLSILGASGSGKSTLLNIISGQLKKKKNFDVSGEILLNGNKMSWSKYQNLIGFVMQSDIFLETMSIEEIFRFVVDLREPDLTREEKENRVNSVIRDLKLENCRKNVVGGRFVKGISGGEKRRLNIGFELLKNPKILFLDEPTSGLDSYTGYIIVKILKNLAKTRNILVIYTIHQPSLDMSGLFEKVLILNKGRASYFGKRESIEEYYESLNYPCPKGVSIMDHAIDISIKGGKEADKKFFETFEKSGSKHTEITSHIQSIPKQKISIKVKKASFPTEFSILFTRSLKNFFRNPLTMKIRLIQVIFIALLYLILYWQMSEVDASNQITIQSRLGALYFISTNFFMLYFQTAIGTFPSERKVFRKEYNSGLYGVTSYFVSKLIIEIPLTACFPILFTCIAYFGVNLYSDFEHFLFFGIGGVLICLTSTLLGIFYSSFMDDLQTAIQMAPLIFVPFLLFSGFTTNVNNLIAGLDFLQYLSPIRFAFEYFVTNEFKDYDLKEFNPINFLNFSFGLNWLMIIFGIYSFASVLFTIFSMKFNSKPLSN